MMSFLQNQKNPETETFLFCIITFEPIKIQTHSAPQNDHLNISFVKDVYVVGKKMTKNGRKMTVYQSQILVISLQLIILGIFGQNLANLAIVLCTVFPVRFLPLLKEQRKEARLAVFYNLLRPLKADQQQPEGSFFKTFTKYRLQFTGYIL